MPLTSSFLHNYRSAGQPPEQLERVIAVGRAFLATSGFVAIYLDPAEPTRLQAITYAVLLSYALYSVAVLAYVRQSAALTLRHGQMFHALDIAWTSALTFVSEGPVSPFFLFFLFVLLAAAYRGGFRETAGTALIIVVVFLAETGIAWMTPWGRLWFMRIELSSVILRVAYLLLTGVLLGYLAEQQKRSRAELAAIADIARQPRVHLGLGGSVTAIARMLLGTFDASAAVVVMRDHESRRTLLWRLDRAAAGRDVRVRRVELDPPQEAAWLFEDFGAAWHATAAPAAGGFLVHATQPGMWPLARRTAELPERLMAAQQVRTVTAANTGLPGEWRGRLYLFDAKGVDSLARSLHFLEALTDHVAPALTNVFLLRRLRARAGAAERARVARELHDGAIQALFGIELKLEAFRRAGDRSAAFIDREIEEVQELLRREVLALRELMQAMRPIELEESDQVPDVLSALVDRFGRDTGICARFVATGGRVPLPPDRAIEMVRIVQEALANVRRHSGARNVLVSLSGEEGACRLVVEDDGCGFPFEGRLPAQELARRRVGPSVIRERARMAGAHLSVESTPGGGARLELEFQKEAAVG